METVTDLQSQRSRRAARRAAAELLAPLHPALRWTVTADDYAHRRSPAGTTVCGVEGPLRLASSRAVMCPVCYPRPV